jgi:RHS repeat-associated protein
VVSDYSYDELYRLTDLSHDKSGAGNLSSFTYTLLADGMRKSLNETLKLPVEGTEQHTVTYTYDNLNRLINETAKITGSGTNTYTGDYTYDLVGNRISRQVHANGQFLTTEYSYYAGSDRLYREIHTSPVAAADFDNEQIYAYTDSGRISYKTATGKSIGRLYAHILGLPNELSLYLFYIIFALIPISFLVPSVYKYISRFRRPPPPRRRAHLSLWQKGLCVLLAYIMLISPFGFEQTAEAASQYADIATTDWHNGSRTITYTYDDNGSCITKTTAVTGGSTLETIQYDYNLQNRLSKQTVRDGSDVLQSWTKFTYNDNGIRVRKEHFDGIDTTITTYLVDTYNHTGYTQTLEEWSDGGSTPDVTYTIGDDVITQSKGSTVEHFLYDGHGSTRQLSDTDGDITDCMNYDAYGVMLGYTGTPSTNLRYTGEYYDNNLSQYYLRARNYDPSNGRFNRIDPFQGSLQDPQSLHKYLYCHANPANAIDPSGNKSISLTETLVVISIVSLRFFVP